MTAPTADPRPDRRLPMLSRRQVVAAGLAALPALVAARAITALPAVVAAAAEPAPVGPAAVEEPIVAVYDATAHRWGFVVDCRACIGCGLCVEACRAENSVPERHGATRTWIERRTLTSDGDLLVESPEAGAHGFPIEVETGAAAGAAMTVADGMSAFVPRLCFQCDNSPCVSVCPVSANHKTADGVVLVDQDRCIGCGYCVVACPYGARYIVPSGSSAPTGNAGVADKCTFCYHRITKGRQPACVEICPTRARNFGDLNDPTSTVSVLLRDEETVAMKESLGTQPRLRYIGLPASEQV